MLDIKDIEIYAKENYVPIARKQTIEFILNLMKERNYTRFLDAVFSDCILALCETTVW